MTIIIPIILIAALLVPAIAISSATERKRFTDINEALQKLNETLKLELNVPEKKFLPEEYPSLSGNLGRDYIKLYIEKTHKNKTLVIEIPCNINTDTNFCIREQTALDSVGIVAGEKDIEIGDPVFDKKFFLSSNQPEKIKATLMDATIRRFALENFSIFEKGIITLENGKLQYRHYSPLFVLKNKEKTLKIIEFLGILEDKLH